MTKQYWHELTNEQQKEVLAANKQNNPSLEQWLNTYAQPDWCRMEDALNPWHCWGLLYGHCHTSEDCKECEFHKDGAS